MGQWQRAGLLGTHVCMQRSETAKVRRRRAPLRPRAAFPRCAASPGALVNVAPLLPAMAGDQEAALEAEAGSTLLSLDDLTIGALLLQHCDYHQLVALRGVCSSLKRSCSSHTLWRALCARVSGKHPASVSSADPRPSWQRRPLQQQLIGPTSPGFRRRDGSRRVARRRGGRGGVAGRGAAWRTTAALPPRPFPRAPAPRRPARPLGWRRRRPPRQPLPLRMGGRRRDSHAARAGALLHALPAAPRRFQAWTRRAAAHV